jgi:hypothetical protein
VPDDSFEAEAEAVEILRGVGKIARTARESAVSDGGRDVVEIMKQLTSSELTREELYLHEIRLENP